MSGPLTGLRVLEVGQVLAGPYCGMLLADLGAEVIKIEPPAGDIGRLTGPHSVGPHNTYFSSLNRNKMSVVLDLGAEAGQQALRELAASADALVANLGPPAIRKLGLTYEALRTCNPRLVCVALTGYGLNGPYSDRPAYDYVIQAMTGVMALTGDPNGPPTKTGYSAVDNSAGIMAALGLVAKIVERKGGQVDVAMYDVMLSQLNYVASAWLNAADLVIRLPDSAHPFLVPAQLFRTRDGWLALFVGHDESWRRFCSELERPDWATDARFATVAARLANRDAIVSAIAAVVAPMETDVLVDALTRAGIVAAAVSTLDRALANEQTAARGMVVSIPTSAGPIRLVASPIKFIGSTAHYGVPPLLGEHNGVFFPNQPTSPGSAQSRPVASKSAPSGSPEGFSMVRRRALSRDLTQIADATVDRALQGLVAPPARAARRIGITGPPGAGKSTLIGRLARCRLDRDYCVGVIAVDPTSRVTRGAFLGDRIRMELVADDPRIFIRSLASRNAEDGLADNISDVLAVMDTYGFDEVILETVGIGQADHGLRTLVDTVVLVVPPDAGDRIQAMKAGVLEAADIYVVNKADLPRAEKVAAELRSIVKPRGQPHASWTPPVLLVSAQDAYGLLALDEAIAGHLAWVAANSDPLDAARARKEYHVRSLILRRVSEILSTTADAMDGTSSVSELYDRVLSRLASHPDLGCRPQ
jgi:LAO/AO transport system ATPase